MQKVSFILLVLFPIFLLAENKKDSLQEVPLPIKKEIVSGKLFVVKGTITSNFEKINVQSEKICYSPIKNENIRIIPKKTKPNKAQETGKDIQVEKETDNSDFSPKIIPVRNNNKSMLSGNKRIIAAIASSINYLPKFQTHKANTLSCWGFPFYSTEEKIVNYNLYKFTIRKKFLHSAQGIRPPPPTV